MSMQVNFYILSDDNNERRLHFIYRLIYKAFIQQKTVWLLCDEDKIDLFSDLIWANVAENFIPHDVIKSEEDIDLLKQKKQSKIIVINRVYLNKASSLEKPEIIVDVSSLGEPISFGHVMLVTNQHPEILSNSRLKFQSYKQINITPKVLKMDEKN